MLHRPHKSHTATWYVLLLFVICTGKKSWISKIINDWHVCWACTSKTILHYFTEKMMTTDFQGTNISPNLKLTASQTLKNYSRSLSYQKLGKFESIRSLNWVTIGDGRYSNCIMSSFIVSKITLLRLGKLQFDYIYNFCSSARIDNCKYNAIIH